MAVLTALSQNGGSGNLSDLNTEKRIQLAGSHVQTDVPFEGS